MAISISGNCCTLTVYRPDLGFMLEVSRIPFGNTTEGQFLKGPNSHVSCAEQPVAVIIKGRLGEQSKAQYLINCTQ